MSGFECATPVIRPSGSPGGEVLREGFRLPEPEDPGGLTNEVQRRAKRVRCNAGLGGCALLLAALSDGSTGVVTAGE